MKTEERLQEGIKQMVLKIPVDEITVTSLCEFCGTNRQTFYYHYCDIYDLVQSIFMKRSQVFITNITRWDDAMCFLISYIRENKVCISALMKSSFSQILKDFFYDIIYVKMYREHLIASDFKDLTNEDAKFIARFYAAGFSSEICHFIDIDDDFNQEEMIRKFHVFSKAGVPASVHFAVSSYKKDENI
ncbi:MAG: TetR-like C-terminal domain-containing protein [Bacilli bacterium]|jgi:AcrR family transcriptional regulator